MEHDLRLAPDSSRQLFGTVIFVPRHYSRRRISHACSINIDNPSANPILTLGDSQEIVSNLLQVGQMGHQQGLPQPGEIAVVRILDLDDTPRVPTTTDGFPVDHELLFRADNGERE